MNPEQQAERYIKLKPFYLYWRSQLPALADNNLEVAVRNGVMYMKTWLLMEHKPVPKSKVVSHAEKVSFLVPANWFEHLKERVLPWPVKTLWPVRYNELSKEVVFQEAVQWEEGPYYICPHLNARLEEDHLVFLNPEAKQDQP